MIRTISSTAINGHLPNHTLYVLLLYNSSITMAHPIKAVLNELIIITFNHRTNALQLLILRSSIIKKNIAEGGQDVLRDPNLNKGLAFTIPERKRLSIHGLYPASVEDPSLQVECVPCPIADYYCQHLLHVLILSIKLFNVIDDM
jgi:hypothetical protein